MPAATAVMVGGQVAATAAQTVAQITDIKKRREFEQRLATLSNEQRAQLDRDLLRAGSADRRIEILANSLASVRAAQSTTAIKARQEAQTKREITTAIVVVGGAALILIAVVLLKRK